MKKKKRKRVRDIWRRLVDIDSQQHERHCVSVISFGMLVCLMKSLVVVVCVARRLYLFESSFLYATLHSLYIVIWWMKNSLGWMVQWNNIYMTPKDLFSVTISMLLMYVSLPCLIEKTHEQLSIHISIAGLSLYIMGVVLNVASDIEKSVCREHKSGVVARGLWSLCRNPNYLGECCIYLSFTLFINRLPAWIIFFIQQIYWIERMKKKEHHMLTKYTFYYRLYIISTPYLYIPFIY